MFHDDLHPTELLPLLLPRVIALALKHILAVCGVVMCANIGGGVGHVALTHLLEIRSVIFGTVSVQLIIQLGVVALHVGRQEVAIKMVSFELVRVAVVITVVVVAATIVTIFSVDTVVVV